jgi:hypothetical protein
LFKFQVSSRFAFSAKTANKYSDYFFTGGKYTREKLLTPEKALRVE